MSARDHRGDREAHGRAFARAGLLGNPSDGYGGKTISLIVRNFSAEVSLRSATRLEIDSPTEPLAAATSLPDLQAAIQQHGYYGAGRLVLSALKRFVDYFGSTLDYGTGSFRVSVTSSIPRLVGLAGSSAIVIATLRALQAWYGVAIPPHLLASLALSCEREELGIPAGLQDRVAQAFEGLLFMDFSPAVCQVEKGLTFGQYESLPLETLPNFYLAYSRRGSEPTEVVHGDLRQRFQSGEPRVLAAMRRWAELAVEGRAAWLAQDWEQLHRRIDENFDLRQSICALNPHHVAMIAAARQAGCSAKYCGSGGAILGLYRDNAQWERLCDSLRQLDCEIVRPLVTDV